MISLIHPGFLYAAAGVALGIVALHFIITEQPRTGILPTVRFFPDVRARATTLTFRMSDILLLAVRVLTCLLVGAAFAQPRINPPQRAVARIVALDISRNTPSLSALARRAERDVADAAAVVLFDSTAREVSPGAALDSLAARTSGTGGRQAAGKLSPALIASLRAAARVRERADSVEIVVYSSLAAEERDAGTLAIRSLWPGRIRVARLEAVTDSSERLDAGRVSVEWSDSAGSREWVRKPRPDTVGAVGMGSTVLIYPFVRRWQLATPTDSGVRIAARWVDGEPAVVERATDDGCVRSVGVSLPVIGDAMLRPEFIRFRNNLLNPCGDQRDGAPLPAEFVSALEGPPRLAPAAAIQPRTTRMTPPVPWILAAALMMALIELLVRRRRQVRLPEAANAKPDAAGNTRPGRRVA